MKRKLSPWCKEVKKAMIDNGAIGSMMSGSDMSIADLAAELNLSSAYITRIINGTFIIPETKKRISKYLDISSELISS